MSATSETTRTIRARAARRSATIFNYGNLLAVLIPMPVGVLWFAASIAVYIMFRHHPNPRVGHYTQWAAYRFYGLVGLVVVIATFYGTSLQAWLITWAVLAAVLIPWTLYDLFIIYKREQWQDTQVEAETYS
jgi:multisubunit Na+/H+ antiporter MnhB subunit